MSSGKKNYFRHYNSAFEDEKIQKCIQLLGYEGYAYFFILVELFAKQCENSFKNPITLHQQSVRIVLRKQQQSCKKVIEKLQESGLFVATFRESFIDFDIPNLEKYMGKYENKNHPNTPNKRKEKEIKVKESKEIISSKKISTSKASSGKSPMSIFNLEAEVIEWLDGGVFGTQQKLLDSYDHQYLAKAVNDAYSWKSENKVNRSSGTFLTKWVERDKHKVFKGGMNEADKKLYDFFIESGCAPQKEN
jgi:hypothetical protein